jgi:hypothetical protein
MREGVVHLSAVEFSNIHPECWIGSFEEALGTFEKKRGGVGIIDVQGGLDACVGELVQPIMISHLRLRSSHTPRLWWELQGSREVPGAALLLDSA